VSAARVVRTLFSRVET